MPPRGSQRGQLARRQAAAAGAAVPVLTDFIARGDGAVTTAELEAAEARISTLSASANHDISVLLAHVDERQAVNILTLFGLALRGSGGSQGADDARARYRRLRVTLSKELAKLFRTVIKPDASQRQKLLLRLALRTHVLRCYSQLLTTAAEQLKQRSSHRNAEAAREVLTEVEELLWSLEQALTVVIYKEASHAEKKDFVTDLRSELLASGLLDTWAACFLQLVGHEDGHEDGPSSDTALLLHRFLGTLHILELPSACAYLLRDIPAPFLQYLLTQHTVQALALLDGGSTYGLPEGAPRVPVPGPSGKLIRGGGSGGVVDVSLLQLALGRFANNRPPVGGASAVRAAPGHEAAPDPASALMGSLPSLHYSAGFDIALRLALAEVASARAYLGVELQPRRGAVLLPQSCGGSLAARALVQAHLLLSERRDGKPLARWAPGDAARLRSLWAAYVSAVDIYLAGDAGFGKQFGVVAARPAYPSAPLTGLPEGPGTVVDAMLSAGAVSCCERLMRVRPDSALLLGLDSNWPELLLFGKRDELEALAASAAKATLHACQLFKQLPPAPTRDALARWVKADTGVGTRLGQLCAALGWLGTMFSVEAFLQLAPLLADATRAAGAVSADGGSSGGSSTTEAGAAGLGDGGVAARQAAAEQLCALYSCAAERLLLVTAMAVQKAAVVGSCAWPEALLRAQTERVLSESRLATVEVLRWSQLLLTGLIRNQDVVEDAPDSQADSVQRARAEGEEWLWVLLCGLRLFSFLRAVAEVLPDRLRGPRAAEWSEVATAFKATLRLTLTAFPAQMLRNVLQDQPEDMKGWRGVLPSLTASGAAVGQKASTALGRELRGGSSGASSSAAGSAAGSGPAAGAGGGATPLTSRLLSLLGPDGPFADAELWEAVRAVQQGSRVPPLRDSVDPKLAAAAALLPPPSAARQGLRCCANVWCENPSAPGDSLLTKKCSGCERVWYCSGACREKDWQARHMVECPGGAPGHV